MREIFCITFHNSLSSERRETLFFRERTNNGERSFVVRSTTVFQKAKKKRALFFRSLDKHTLPVTFGERERDTIGSPRIPKGKKAFTRHTYFSLSLFCPTQNDHHSSRDDKCVLKTRRERERRRRRRRRSQTTTSDRDSTSDPYI